MKQNKSTSLRQLPPVTRYYIRRLLKETLNAVSLRHGDNNRARLWISSLEEDLDPTIEALLNRGGNYGEKLAELERLAFLFQRLSNDGTRLQAEIMSTVINKVAELFNLSFVLEPKLASSPEESKQMILTTQSATEFQLKSPLQPVTLYEYLTKLNAISHVSQKFLGASVTVNYWKSCCPSEEWLAQIQISQVGKLFTEAGDFQLTSEQKAVLEVWGVEFMSRCSRVIRNFEQVLKSAGITIVGQ